VTEFVPGYEAVGWYGIGAPRGTPAAIIDAINAATNAALEDAKLKARLADLGVEPMPKTAAAMEKFIAGENDKWGKVIRDANIRAE
jgi:tripartite-type tricarboxylate transporter receptor subunit TctC